MSDPDMRWFHLANHQGYYALQFDAWTHEIYRFGYLVGRVRKHASGTLLHRYDAGNDPADKTVEVDDAEAAVRWLTNQADHAAARAKSEEKRRVAFLTRNARELYWGLSARRRPYLHDEELNAERAVNSTMGMPELPSLLQNVRVMNTRYTKSRK